MPYSSCRASVLCLLFVSSDGCWSVILIIESGIRSHAVALSVFIDLRAWLTSPSVTGWMSPMLCLVLCLLYPPKILSRCSCRYLLIRSGSVTIVVPCMSTILSCWMNGEFECLNFMMVSMMWQKLFMLAWLYRLTSISISFLYEFDLSILINFTQCVL